MRVGPAEPGGPGADRSTGRELAERTRRWLPAVVWGIVGAAVLFQAYAYYFKLPLSLGPRVILEPWLLRHGFVLYETAVDIHTPLVPLLLAALSALFPDGLTLARAVVVVLLSITTLLTFLATKRNAGWVAGLWAVFWFGVWSPRFEFGKLWYEAFLTPIYLGFFLIYRPSARARSLRSCALIGLLGGLAVLVKQHAAVVFLAFVAWHIFTGFHFKRPRREVVREVAAMGLSSAVPVAAFAIYQLITAKTLSGFLYWTVGYALTGVYTSLASQLPSLSQLAALASCAFFLPAALICVVERKKAGDESWLVVAWGLILVLLSSLAVYPRFELFHLQGTLPVLVVVCSIGLEHIARTRSGRRRFTVAIPLAMAILWVLTAGRAYHPVLERNAARQVIQYSDLVPTARELRRKIGPSESVYIVPDDELTSNLYYLLGCRPPGFWTFHYPWLMVGRVKTRITTLLRKAPPQWVVYFPDRWDVETNQPEIVSFLKSRYREAATLQYAENRLVLLQRK
jgi:hypothetical protein